jgi:uncharacterized damage-inducible protein DinB
VVLPDEARQRVVSYLAHQGRKDTSAIVHVVERERRRLVDMLVNASQEQAELVPSPGQWSIRDVVEHVVAAERGVTLIISRLAGAGAPQDEPPVAGQSLAELRQQRSEARTQLLSLVGALPEDANIEAKHEHLFFGLLNWKEWLAFQRVHDGDHIEQIEAIQRSPSYPKA